MSTSSDIALRKKQFARVIKALEQMIRLEAMHRHCTVDEALDALSNKREAIFADSLERVSHFAPAKEYRSQVHDLIMRDVWPSIDQLLPRLPDRQLERLEKEKSAKEQQIEQIKSEVRRLAIDCAMGLFTPRLWSMDYTDGDPPVKYTWRGADVRITDNPLTNYQGASTLVVTPYAMELAGLFILARDTCADALDHMTKLSFYPHLAKAAIAAHQRCDQLTLRALTLEVLGAWSEWLDNPQDELWPPGIRGC